MITLPGLIDPHVHLRDPGQTHKEDFTTGTAAALAGGFTTLIDMPNNSVPITTLELLTAKGKIAKQKILCDVGFYLGSLGDNLTEFEKVQNKVFGLKLYLNRTTGNFTINLDTFQKICAAWPNPPAGGLPILVHAEKNILEQTINIAHAANQHLHVCHISAEELRIIIKAKEKNYKVTCGITPHHLFLTEKNIESLGTYPKVKPPLGSQEDIDFIWKNLEKIDLVESDHAPHTKEEKENRPSPFGFPGLETTLPLLLTAAHQGRLTIPDIQRLCHDNPAKIFGINLNNSYIPSPLRGGATASPPAYDRRGKGQGEVRLQTYIVIDENKEWTIKNENLKTKSGWSPFNGWIVKGKVKKVVIRGVKIFEDGKILVQPSFGKILKPA